MRIIGGSKKGRSIPFKKIPGTRPTVDKVKEAVFNILGNIEGYTVLDLFAGTGSYGIESLSRGVDFVVFNDKNSEITKELFNALIALDFQINQFAVHTLDYKRLVEFLHKRNAFFSLIFLDPPYDIDYYNELINDMEKITNESSLVVCEMYKKEQLIIPDAFEVIKERIFGDNKIIILKRRK